MKKQDAISAVYAAIAELLSPYCQVNGLSYKTMPSDADAGVIRTAMAIGFVPGYDAQSDTSTRDFSPRQVGMLRMDAYVLVLAASQVGPRSATWASSIVTEALDNKVASNGIRIVPKAVQFTSFKDGVWQYRVPLDCHVPFSTENSDAYPLVVPTDGPAGNGDW